MPLRQPPSPLAIRCPTSNRFAVILTINMEIGLISPPVGLNLYVINGIAPDISLKTILKGSLPFVACMLLAIVLLCVFPGIATWLPEAVMGPAL